MRRMTELHDDLGFDTVVVYDQCFDERHVQPWMTLIGHQSEGKGFVVPRNALLKWFYESDYDFALWMDANAVVSKPQRNALFTLKRWLEEGNCPFDIVQTTFQMWVTGEAILDHQRKSYFDTILVSKITESPKVKDGTLIGMFMSNLKKKYGDEVYIREDCNPWEGTSEDVFLVNALKRLYNVGLCSSLGFTKGGSKSSTWRADNGSAKYAYPPLKKEVLERMISEHIRQNHLVDRRSFMSRNVYEIPRVEEGKDLMKQFKSRPHKRIVGGLLK